MKILLIEDHSELRAMIRQHLAGCGFVVDALGCGAEGLTAIGLTSYDAVVLDLGLPDMDGMDLLATLRRRGGAPTPTLILTARGDLRDRVHGLNAGADDYLVKPFDLLELEARLRAMLRRPGARSSDRLRSGNIELDRGTREVLINAAPVELSRREWVLLKELLQARERVVVKDLLEDRLYACDEAVTPNALEAVVSRLRRKLETAGANRAIESRRGIGYCLKAGSS